MSALPHPPAGGGRGRATKAPASGRIVSRPAAGPKTGGSAAMSSAPGGEGGFGASGFIPPPAGGGAAGAGGGAAAAGGKGPGGGGRFASDNIIAEQIASLQSQGELFTQRIEVERRRGEETDKKLRITSAKLEEEKGKLLMRDGPENIRERQKRLRTLEHRLNKLLVRLNQLVNQNKGKRHVIEDLRRQKMQRGNIRRSLEKEVAEKKKEMLRMLQQSSAAVDARDRAERQIAVLQATIAQEVADFEGDFKERMDVLKDTRAAIIEHSGSAGTMKPPGAGGGVAASDAGSETGPLAPAGNKGEMTVEQEVELKHKSTKACWDTMKREVDLKRQLRRLAALEEDFRKIQRKTGIATIDDMVRELVQAEDQNFALINMINELNKEIETLEVENGDLELQLRAERGKGETTKESRTKVFKKLEDAIRASDRKAAEHEQQHDEALRAIEAMKAGITNVFTKVGCTDEALMETFTATGVTDGNIVQILGVIEQRVAEIVQLLEMSLGKVTDEARNATYDPRRRMVGVTNVPTPPSAADLDSSDDEGVEEEGGEGGATTTLRGPMTLAELRLKTNAQMSKRGLGGPDTV